MTIAGQSAKEDVASIRAAFPRSKVVAVDRDPAAVAQAIAAGAVGVLVDLADIADKAFPSAIAEFEKRFDLINLDLCGLAGDEFRRLLGLYARYGLGPRQGRVLLATFAYGRDSSPFYERTAGRIREVAPSTFDDCPDALRGRVLFLTASSTWSIESVIAYPGKSMPMCSVMWTTGTRARVRAPPRFGGYESSSSCSKDPFSERASFVRLKDVDLRPLCEPLELDALYATPAARISAWRASDTRLCRRSLFASLDLDLSEHAEAS
jgi:hypothetical protein